MAMGFCQPTWARGNDLGSNSQGILLADSQGHILFSKNKKKKRIPASTLKLLTSLAALKTFGPDHRFTTLYTYDRRSQILYIKGKGDPLFTSEIIAAMCDDIIGQTQCESVRQIILDLSFFHPKITIPGTGNSLNPYDSTTGALCANFNTIAFNGDPLTQTYTSAEPQTPLLKIFIPSIRNSGLRKGRILLSLEQRSLYPGQLIQFFLKKQGIQVTGPVQLGLWPLDEKDVFVYKSPFTMDQVVQKLLKYSNNFMANQLMLTLGAYKFGPPATLEKGVRALKDFAEDQLGLSQIAIVEGSGLSRKNSLTPQQMHTILTAFMPFHHLMSVEGNEYYKTGTLSDVRTRAGFFRGKDNRLYPFVIMLNNTRTGYKDILEKLRQKVSVLSGGG